MNNNIIIMNIIIIIIIIHNNNNYNYYYYTHLWKINKYGNPPQKKKNKKTKNYTPKRLQNKLFQT